MTNSKLLMTFLLVFLNLTASAKNITTGRWTTSVHDNGELTILWDGDTIINRSIATWGNQQSGSSMTQCGKVKVSTKKANGILGKSTEVTIKGKTSDNTEATLRLTLSAKEPVMLAELSLEGTDARNGVDYMAPLKSSSPVNFKGTDNRMLFVPYDNDAWVRYSTRRFGEEPKESYETGAIFDGASRRGIILGSIDHNLWKSAIRYNTSGQSTVDSLETRCGATSSLTRDVRRHGLVKGNRVSSPRFVVIVTPDWRDGLETFADLCATVAPNKTKGGARPFGWNSWGDLQTKINFENACQVSDFIHDNLSSSFHAADSSVIINLDAFWDFGLNNEQHRQFVAKCRANNQKPAIYYCPFTDWGKNPDVTVGEAPQYKMGDLYLRHDGKPIEFDGAPALDPTHPGTRARIERQLNQFKEWGYEYVKIDFMAHGAYESDSHFDPKVMTGTQAFCSGMEFIDSVADNKMWINLSIAPLFPACYAQSRRIGCDAWSNIGSTEYTLNALTYGWWLDHMYHYNDADHIVFKGVTEGENRARLLSSAITGVYFLGDDFSQTGDSTTMERARRFATVDRINDMARRTKSFRPLRPGNGESAADIFEGRDGNTTVWVALFNYGEENKPMTFSLDELNIGKDNVDGITELWSGKAISLGNNGTISATLPSKDAMIFEINLINK